MYCPSCGAQSTQGLQFCKRCGANLMPPEPLIHCRKPGGLGWLIAILVLMMGMPIPGLAIVYEFANNLINRSFPPPNVTGLAVVGLLVILGTEGLLYRLLSRLISVYIQAEEPVQPARPRPILSQPQPQIGAPHEGMASVTEHTTRNFDPVGYRVDQ
jgi:hypothetical protein